MTRRVTLMCFMILTTFTVTLTPFSLTVMALGMGNLEVRPLVKPLWVLALTNACLNPIIYGFMWKSFRLAAVQVRNPKFILNCLIPHRFAIYM